MEHQAHARLEVVPGNVARADAAAFTGVLSRNWEGALLVARSAEPGTGGPRTGRFSASSKLSFRAFAEVATCHRETVSRYYETWERAANEGLVPHAKDLAPGDHVDLSALTAKQWGRFYTGDGEPKLSDLSKKLDATLANRPSLAAGKAHDNPNFEPYEGSYDWFIYAEANPEWAWKATRSRVREALWVVDRMPAPTTTWSMWEAREAARELRQAADALERDARRTSPASRSLPASKVSWEGDFWHPPYLRRRVAYRLTEPPEALDT